MSDNADGAVVVIFKVSVMMEGRKSRGQNKRDKDNGRKVSSMPEILHVPRLAEKGLTVNLKRCPLQGKRIKTVVTTSPQRFLSFRRF